MSFEIGRDGSDTVGRKTLTVSVRVFDKLNALKKEYEEILGRVS